MKLKNIVRNQFGNIGAAQSYLKAQPWGSTTLVVPSQGDLSSIDLLLISSIYREISKDEQGYFCEGAGPQRFCSKEALIENIQEQEYLIPNEARAGGFTVTESAAEGTEEKSTLVITGVITPFKIEKDKYSNKYFIKRDEANIRQFSSIQHAIDDLLFEQLAKLYSEENDKRALLEFNGIVHGAIPLPLQRSLLSLRRCLIVDTLALIEKGEAPTKACSQVSMPILVCINNMLCTISIPCEGSNIKSPSLNWFESSQQTIQHSREELLPNKWVIFGKVLLIIALGGAAVAFFIGGFIFMVLCPAPFPGMGFFPTAATVCVVVTLMGGVPSLSLMAAIFMGCFLFAEQEKEQAIEAVLDATEESLSSSSGKLIRGTFWHTPAVDPIGNGVSPHQQPTIISSTS